LVADLKAKRRTRNGEPRLLSSSDRAHLDPDLVSGLQPRKPGWLPAYGQCGGAATILHNHQVEKGDLFVFFGWFRRCELKNGMYGFVRGEPDIHVLFGYLSVGQVVRLSSDTVPEWAADHPHLHGNDRKNDPGNTLFIAADKLSLPGATDLPGAAAFPKYSDALRLTAPGRTRSIWRLPSFFHPVPGVPPLSFHENPDRWCADNDRCLLQSVGRGQEFVLQVEHYPKVIEWVTEVICQGTEART
jgi:hypothetical protein